MKSIDHSIVPCSPDSKPGAERIQELYRKWSVPTGVVIPKTAIIALKKRVLLHIRDLCEYLFPEGRLSSQGGYWQVPSPYKIKVSFLTGNYFDWDKPGDRKPMGDILDLWRAKETNFRLAFPQIERWCDAIEKRGETGETWATESVSIGTVEELEEAVFILLLDEGRIPVVRGTARHLWKMVVNGCDKSGIPQEERPFEFLFATKFLWVLKFWASRERSGMHFLLVTEKSRSKKTEFVLTIKPDSPELNVS
jgi:hypothetical protein